MVSLKMQSNPWGPGGSPWLLLDLSGQWGLSWLSLDPPPSQSISHPGAWCSFCYLKGNALCNSPFKLICGLSGYILALFSLCCLLQLCGDTKGKKAKYCQLSVTLKGFFSLLLCVLRAALPLPDPQKATLNRRSM